MLGSVAIAIGRRREDLEAALRDFDETARPEHESLLEFLPRAVLASLDVAVEDADFVGTYWFHRTRTLDPASSVGPAFCRYPRSSTRYGKSLYTLVRDDVDSTAWNDFRRRIEAGGGGHNGRLYRVRPSNPGDHGPHAELVRDVFFHPNDTCSVDYLRMPETVEDIAVEATAFFGVPLGERFLTAATPCIVKFSSNGCPLSAIEAALWYGWMMLTAGRIHGRGANCGREPTGAIAPANVSVVEIVARE